MGLSLWKTKKKIRFFCTSTSKIPVLYCVKLPFTFQRCLPLLKSFELPSKLLCPCVFFCERLSFPRGKFACGVLRWTFQKRNTTQFDKLDCTRLANPLLMVIQLQYLTYALFYKRVKRATVGRFPRFGDFHISGLRS